MSNAGNAVTTTAVPIAVARAVPTNKLKSMHRRVKVPPTPKKTGFVFVRVGNEKMMDTVGCRCSTAQPDESTESMVSK